MKKPLIYAVVGASGCGKTTATKIMEKYGIPSLVSYTTRSMRNDETNGVEHWFVDENEMPPKDKMLAYTYFGNNHYWTTIDQIPQKGCTYIIDEVALVEMIKNFQDKIEIIKILIKKDRCKIEEIVDAERMHRDAERMALSDDFYDIIITNNGTIDELERQILDKIIALK